MIRHQARRNREWYDRGLALLPLLDARGAAYVEALAGPHTRLLERIERSPTDVLRGRRARKSPDRGDRAHGQSRPVACRLIGSQQPSGSF